MGNICSFHSSSPLSHANPSFNNFVPRTYDVFIGHRGKDTKQNTASHLYHNLKNKGYTVFFDKNSIGGGEPITESIKHAIHFALVHVVIFSPRYAESEWCLDELYLMLKTRAPIVLVFWGIKSSGLRMEDEDGVYAQAFQKHKQAGKFKACTLRKWEKALRDVSDRKGFTYNGDQGETMEKIAVCVAKYIEEAKSQP